MPKRKTLAAAAVCLVAVIALATLLARDKEPSYQGRSLSDWLRLPEQLDSPDESKLSPQTCEAVRSIGTNAIPIALRWISYEPSPFTLKLLHFMQQFAPVIGTRSMAKGDRFAFYADNVFAILASDARPAIPELTHLAITARTDTRVFRCTRALVHIGPEAAVGLIGIVSAPDCKARWVAALYLAGFGSNAAPAIPILLQSTDDKDDRLACAALAALGELALSPSTVIPVLTTSLQCTNVHRRAYAARALANFGVAATNAAPQLQQALSDPTQEVSEAARKALVRIAPERLTNATPH